MPRSVDRIIVLLLISSQFLTACGQDKMVKNNSYGIMLKTLLSHTVDEASVMEFLDGTSGTTLLDARERAEFDVSHINNAIWVGYENFTLDRVSGISADDDILVYCSVGYRSEKIAEKLSEAGFRNVRNLYGGIFEWKNRDGEVVDSLGQPTDVVHAYNKSWGIWLKKGKKVYK